MGLKRLRNIQPAQNIEFGGFTLLSNSRSRQVELGEVEAFRGTQGKKHCRTRLQQTI